MMDENPYQAPQIPAEQSTTERDCVRVAAIIFGVTLVGSVVYGFIAMWGP
jgi:hypothetical protein